jgi:predicted Zn-dependent protease
MRARAAIHAPFTVATLAACLLAAPAPARHPSCTVSSDDERRLGDLLAADVAKRLQLVDDAERARILQELGLELAARALPAGGPWTFHLVREDEARAFTLPGGHVHVTDGMVRACADGSELAAVLAHEVAHAAAGDVGRQLGNAYGSCLVAAMARGEHAGTREGIAANLALSGTLGRHSHAAERAADAKAVQLLREAGWDATAMLRVLEKQGALRASEPDRPSRHLAAHPIGRSRVEDLRAALAALPPAPPGRRDDERFARLR